MPENDTLDRPLRMLWYTTDTDRFEIAEAEMPEGMKGWYLIIHSRQVLESLAKDINDKLKELDND